MINFLRLSPIAEETTSCSRLFFALSSAATKTSRLPIAIQQAAMCRLRGKLAQVNLKLGRNYPESKLSYTQCGIFAGTAWPKSYKICLNPVLLLENSEAFIEEVVPYELTRLLVWKYFGRVAPHGKGWRWMMESVSGVPARRTYQLELQSVRRNTFPYRCKCQEHQLTVRRYNRVVRDEAVYCCAHCGEQLATK